MISAVSIARRRLPMPFKLGLAILLAMAADWLFFGWDKGISVAVFFMAAMACAIVANPVHASARQFYGACIVFGLSLLPAVEQLNIVSFCFGLAGTLFFLLVMSGGWPRARHAFGRILVGHVLAAMFRAIAGLGIYRRAARCSGRGNTDVGSIAGWGFSLACGAIFIVLLSLGNPLIGAFAADIDWPELGVWRLVLWGLYFWCALIVTNFSIRHYRHYWRPEPGGLPHTDHRRDGRPLRELLGKALLIRSLVLFNLIFSIQTLLDVIYLWGGAELPKGMTYAEYAYRGFYPLLMTAILAAGFMLLALKEGGQAEASAAIRRLIYLWVAQNVLLVISAIMRLNLYVEAYSLTMMRMAVFIWMGLVIGGFILIAVRIALRRSNSWLVSMNAGAAITALYLCCFINFPAVIVGYNVANAQVRTSASCGNCFGFDFTYASGLGMQAYPEIDRFLVSAPQIIEACRRESEGKTPSNARPRTAFASHDGMANAVITSCDRLEKEYEWQLRQRNVRVAQYLSQDRNWRSWSYGDKRALNYLAQNVRIEPGRSGVDREQG